MPTTLPPELRVEIRKVGDQYLAVTARPNDAEICSNIFTHDADKLVHLEPQWMLERGARNVAESLRMDGDAVAREGDAPSLARYGQRLYAYLFGDGVRLQTFFEFNDAYKRQARLTLALHPDAVALWSLPWEYLHDGHDFLCLSGRLLLSRVPHGIGEMHVAESAPPLRILVVIAAPDDQAELDVERELAVIQDALDKARQDGLVQIDVLEDATWVALQDALARQSYHVLHYTGHGAFNAKERKGQLCFETDTGQSHLVSADDLRPLLLGARDLRLVVLSACQSAKTSGLDAFDSVATGLLRDLPAVLAMQFSVLDDSAIEMARVLYGNLAQGQTPIEAMQAARLALDNFDKQREQKHEPRRYDWGVPSLYLRAQAMRLIDMTVGAHGRAPLQEQRRDLGGLPKPRIFVGRRTQLRDMRRALRDRLPAIYVRGIGGVGKSTLAAKLMERSGVALDGTLVIRCNELPLPSDALSKLANFWRAQGKQGHSEAADRLLDSRLDPAERARQAVQLVGERRYLIVFDNLESWFARTADDSRVVIPKRAMRAEESLSSGVEIPHSVRNDNATRNDDEVFDIADETVRAALRGLLLAQSRSTFLFTARYLWAGVEALPRTNWLDIHLPELTKRQAILLMNALPRLAAQPLADKLAAHQRVGGHPKTLELLDGWLEDGRSLRAWLNDPDTTQRMAKQWEAYFLADLLARLAADERDALTTLAILEEPFWQGTADELVGAIHSAAVPLRDESPLRRWHDLSLIQFERTDKDGDAWYSIHPVVREYLLGKLDADARRALHARAAVYYGKPFVDAARKVYRRGDSRIAPTDEQIESLARGARGVVGAWVARTDDMPAARAAMQRALAWQQHLFAAGQADAAGEIVIAAYDILARWGQRDAAKALLRRSIDTLEGGNRAAAQGNLATLLKDEGHLQAVLQTYEQVYQTFDALDAQPQMAVVLSQMSIVYQSMGDYDQAIAKQEASLHIKRAMGNEEGQASSLHQLSRLYRHKEDYDAALARSAEAEQLFRKLGIEAHIAATLHQQGLIFVARNRPADAFARFRDSLEINRRIGNDAGAANSLGELGKLLMNDGQMPDAIAAFNEALKIHQRLGDPKMGITLELLGIVHEMQGEFAAALEKYEQARQIYQQAMPTGTGSVE